MSLSDFEVLANCKNYDQYDNDALACNNQVKRVALIALIDMSADHVDDKYTDASAQTCCSKEYAST